MQDQYEFPIVTSHALKKRDIQPEEDGAFKVGWDQQIMVLSKEFFEGFQASLEKPLTDADYVVDEADQADKHGAHRNRYILLVGKNPSIAKHWDAFTASGAYGVLLQVAKPTNIDELNSAFRSKTAAEGGVVRDLHRWKKKEGKVGPVDAEGGEPCESYEQWLNGNFPGSFSYKYEDGEICQDDDGLHILVFSTDIATMQVQGIGAHNTIKAKGHASSNFWPGGGLTKGGKNTVLARKTFTQEDVDKGKATPDQVGKDKKADDVEVKYWQAAAIIKAGELDAIYRVKKDDGKARPNDDAKLEPDFWEMLPIKTAVNKDKPENSPGLTHTDQQEVLKIWGINQLTPKNQVPAWQKLLNQFLGFFSLLLEVGGILCFVAYVADPTSPENLYLGVVLWIVVTITCVFSFLQEQNADDMMQKFKEMGGAKNQVRRNEGGASAFKDEELFSTEIVPGDVVHLRYGDKITCDFRVLSTIGEFNVKEAALTGESHVIHKHNKELKCRHRWHDKGWIGMDVSADPHTAILKANQQGLNVQGDKSIDEKEQKELLLPDAIRCDNIIMCGTDIGMGGCVALAVATGDWTVMGLLYDLASKDSDDETPLAKEIHRFVLIISGIAIFLGILFLVISIALGLTPINTIVFTIGIIVANVPEGLLATVTVSLTLTAERMKDVQVLVKNLESVETLGSTSVICSDKTGTLTQNKMTIVYGWTPQIKPDGSIGGAWWDADAGRPENQQCQNPWQDYGDDYSLRTMNNLAIDAPTPEGAQLRDVLQVAALCSSAKWDEKPRIDPRTNKVILAFKDMKPWEKGATGDASEQALLKFSEARIPDGVLNYRTKFPDVGAGGTIPFDSKNKWMAQTKYVPNPSLGGCFFPKGDEEKTARVYFKGGADVVVAKCIEQVQVPYVDIVKKGVPVGPGEGHGDGTFFMDTGTAGRKHKPESLKVKYDEAWQNELQKVMSLMAQQGLRLFALAYADIPPQYTEDKATFESGRKDTPGSLAHMLSTPEGDKKWDEKKMLEEEPRKPLIGRHFNNPYNKDTPNTGASNWSLKSQNTQWKGSLTLCGILAIQDPPRAGVLKAVTTCHEASIQVVMVTGDNPDTGAAIAQQIGILWGTTKEQLVTLAQLIGPDELDRQRALAQNEGKDKKDWKPPQCRMFDKKPPAKGNAPRLQPGRDISDQVKDWLAAGAGKTGSDWSAEYKEECARALEATEDWRTKNDKDNIYREPGERFRTSRAVSGDEINKWDRKVYTYDWWKAFQYVMLPGKKGLVFARTSPAQKQIIVEHFQMAHTPPVDWGNDADHEDAERGKQILTKDKMITAVTGDGVNDAPAIKAAAIGICMGIAGTDVTKEAADMILMDDNFASIVKGVSEGRLVFDNLKKSIAYTLSSNIPEISPFICFILIGLPLPLSTVLILCVDLGTDMVPAISLAYENPERDIMQRRPRTSADNLVTGKLICFSYFQIGIIQALAGFYSFFAVLYTEGLPPDKLPWHGELQKGFELGGPPLGGFSVAENIRAQKTAQTAFFICIIVVQWSDILICKTRKLSIVEQGMKNDILNFGLFFETTLGLFLVYTPVRVVFMIQRLKFVYWLPGIPFALLIFTYDEVRKSIMRQQDDCVDWIKKMQAKTGNKFSVKAFWAEDVDTNLAACGLDSVEAIEAEADKKIRAEKKKQRQQVIDTQPRLIDHVARWVEKMTYW